MTPLLPNAIRGNWATVLLPINADESIDWVRLEEELDRLASLGPDGVYTNGTAGEFFTQTEDEFDRIQHLAAEKFEQRAFPSRSAPATRRRTFRSRASGAPGSFIPARSRSFFPTGSRSRTARLRKP